MLQINIIFLQFFRGYGGSEKAAFRKWYGEIYQFRAFSIQSLLNPDVKFALFTATAQTKHRTLSMLEIDHSETFFIEINPEQKNKILRM